MIEVDDVRFAFEEAPVLDAVTLEVDDGEFVGLIGPNGAGKTTLLRLISGAVRPDSGRIEIDGADVVTRSSSAVSRMVAVVPQETRLSFDFPVRTVVAMGRNPYKSRFDRTTPEDRALVDRALQRTHTAGFADRSFSAISGGEKKRVLIARAIAQDTPNLLLDEPTGGLDINHQVAVFELANRVRDEGKAVLAAVHDLDLAARFCDRLALLHDGSIVAIGPPRDVLEPAALEAAYDIRTRVLTNPVTDTPMVVPARPQRAEELVSAGSRD